MDKQELVMFKKKINLFKRHFGSIFTTNIKYVITTGGPELIYTTVGVNDIMDHKIPVESMVHRVIYKDKEIWDLLLEFCPVLGEKNLFFDRKTFCSIFNKAVTGGDIFTKEFDGEYFKDYIKYVRDGNTVRYALYVDKGKNLYGRAFDKDGKVVEVKLDTVIYTHIPLGYLIDEYTLAWYTGALTRMEKSVDFDKSSEDITTNILDGKRMTLLDAYYETKVPYRDGIFGISMSSYVKFLKWTDNVKLYRGIEGTCIRQVSKFDNDNISCIGGPTELQYFI